MDRTDRINSVKQDGVPDWDVRRQFLTMRNWFRFLIAVIVILWATLIFWVLFLAPITDASASQLDAGATMTMVLAPVLAAAAAVERILVAIFNGLESEWRVMVAYLGRGLRWLKSAETEVRQARQFFADVFDWYAAEINKIQIGGSSIPELTEMMARMDSANRMMSLAQMRLADAEGNLADASSDESYMKVKAIAWIVVGLMLGAVIAVWGQLQMFAILGVGVVPARIDVLVTGLIIGSLSYPVHLIFGILQQGRDVLDSIKGYFNRSAPSVQAITERITTIESPTALSKPTPVQPAVIETTTARTTDQEPKG